MQCVMMEQLAAMQKQGFSDETLLLDVRTEEEFQAGHLPNAVCIPHTELASRLQELKPFKHIVIYCRVGGRARFAADILEEEGFQHLTVASRDGFLSWEAQGFPIER